MADYLIEIPGPIHIITEVGGKGEQGDPGVGLPVGGTTGQIAAKASNADYDVAWVDAPGGGGSDTAEQILAKIITVDGTGSELDADLLDGQHASDFAVVGHAHAGVYDPTGTASAAVTAHEAASDPHPQYLTAAEGDAAYAPVAQGVTGGDAHDHSGGDGAQIAYTSLSGLPTIPAAQVNSDWAASSGVAQILNKPTLGTAAAAATTDFDAAGAATSAVSAHAAVTSSVHGISTFGASLVDDTSASAALITLGLGDSATKNVGTTAGTVAAGDDPRFGGGSVSAYVSTPAIVLCKTLFGGL